MRKVYAIGESLIDIIFKDGEVRAARPGGSMLNSAVSLGRSGTETVFLSELGKDMAGDFVASFLESNGVNTSLLIRYEKGKTPLALAFINNKGDASYDFYKLYPDHRLQQELPNFTSDDIFLFGSFFGIDPAIRPTLLKILNHARDQGTLIVYDPNFRKPHAHELDKLKPMIIENIEMASVIKASNDDLELIFGETEPHNLRKIAPFGEKPLVITHGAKGAIINSLGHEAFFPSKKIDVVSTIGAGDNFNAGFIYGCINQGINSENLTATTPGQWARVIDFAISFAADVCQSYDNYISPGYAAKLKELNH